MLNPFFKNNGPILIQDIIKLLELQIDSNKKNIELNDIKDLYSANNSDITFFIQKNIKRLQKIQKHPFVLH